MRLLLVNDKRAFFSAEGSLFYFPLVLKWKPRSGYLWSFISGIVLFFFVHSTRLKDYERSGCDNFYFKKVDLWVILMIPKYN